MLLPDIESVFKNLSQTCRYAHVLIQDSLACWSAGVGVLRTFSTVKQLYSNKSYHLWMCENVCILTDTQQR